MNKTLELFEEMELELIRFGESDVIATSGNPIDPLGGNGGNQDAGGDAEEPID